MNIKRCELCNSQLDLQDSHFIPKFLYKELERIKKKGTKVRLVNNEDKCFPLGIQIKRHKLCKKCEGLISCNGEEYFSKSAFLRNREITVEDKKNPPTLIKEFINNIEINNDNKKNILKAIF